MGARGRARAPSTTPEGRGTATRSRAGRLERIEKVCLPRGRLFTPAGYLLARGYIRTQALYFYSQNRLLTS
jgi:hypothetical protein